MKRIVAMLLLLLPMMLMAQNTPSRMFVDGRSWKYSYHVPDDGYITDEQAYSGTHDWLHYDYELYVDGDSVVDGRPCRKIMAKGFSGTCLYALGAEEDGRVELRLEEFEPAFYAPFALKEWVTLYDFGANKGDQCHMAAYIGGEVTVEDEGVAQTGGTSHRFMVLGRPGDAQWRSYAVEGIGCPLGLYMFENIISNGSASSFVGCFDNGSCIFSKEDFDNLTFRPVVGVEAVVGSFNSPSSQSFDLQGRRLDHRHAKGIYIKNRKKMWK